MERCAGSWVEFPEVTPDYPREGERLPNHKEEVLFWVEGTGESYPKFGWYDWKHDMIVFSPGTRPIGPQKVTHWLDLNPPQDAV